MISMILFYLSVASECFVTEQRGISEPVSEGVCQTLPIRGWFLKYLPLNNSEGIKDVSER